MCTKCTSLAPLEKPTNPKSDKYKCQHCVKGFILDPKTGFCKACPPHCAFCSTEGTCFTCNLGYFVDGGKCSKIEIKGCYSQATNMECYVCENTYYLMSDRRSCGKCHDSCLMCRGPSEADCTYCAVSKLRIHALYFGINDLSKTGCVD